MRDTVDATVTRGSESWNYLYIMLGFVLTIGATVISMISPLMFPYNMLVFAVFATSAVWLIIFNGKVQNKLISWKNTYESKSR